MTALARTRDTERRAALDILAKPAIAARCPALVADAWFMLAQSRGMTVHLDRLHPPRHLIYRGDTPPDVGTLDAGRALRISAAIARTQARHGSARPRPLILKGAAQ